MDNGWITGAAYIRVSTDDQLELSPESQLSEILRYAKEHHITVPLNLQFIEKEGRSGKKADNRPEFQRMIAAAKEKPKPFDVILVWKFSRFARNQDESTFYKGMLRKKLAINIVSVSEPIMDGMYGRLIEMIIEWQDEFYSYNLGMEVTRGMRENALRGAYQASPPFGYRHRGSKLPPSVDDKEADVVRFIFDAFVFGGKSTRQIASELKTMGAKTRRGLDFEPRSISYILENPFYIGKIRWNRAPRSTRRENPEELVIVSPGEHPPILEETLFEQAQLRIKKTGRGERLLPPASGCRHWLTGILKCPVCGSNLSYNRSKKGFQCWQYAKGRHKGSAYVPAAKAEAAACYSLAGLGDAASAIWYSGGRHCEADSTTPLHYLKDDQIETDLKSEVARSFLDRMVWNKESGEFYIYYRCGDRA